MSLAQIRQDIDAIDGRIVTLLYERMELSLKAGRLKKSIADPEREREVMNHVRSFSAVTMKLDFIDTIYEAIISESKKLQECQAASGDTGEGHGVQTPGVPQRRHTMRIGVLGVGRMGSWLANLLSSEYEVAVYDTDQEKVKQCKCVTVIKAGHDWNRFDPQLLINAVPLRDTFQAYETVLPFLQTTCILCDIASVKNGLKNYYEISGRAFVSVHFMFGPTFADMACLGRQHAVIISDSHLLGADLFRRLLAGLGVTVHELTFEKHDRMMARSLSAPFASTLAFAASMNSTAIRGTTFSKHMDIAEGLLSEDDDMLAEILFNPASLMEIERLAARLEFLKHIIRSRDYEEMTEFLDRCRRNIELS